MTPAEDLKALGDFLRAKRRTLLPEACGVPERRRRLRPGLSREEIAAFANIGASWYARLEAGRVPRPSVATMRAVAAALKLSQPETQFAFELAGILARNASEGRALALGSPVQALLSGDDLIAMTLWDRFLAPIGWNALGEAMYQFSNYPDRVQRNPLVRLEDDFIVKFFGDAFESYARNVVGLFHRTYAAGEPTAYAREVFERASALPTFRKYWDDRVISDSVTPPDRPVLRHHPIVGTFAAIPVDLVLPEHHSFLRVLSAADDESRAKFARLREIGRPFDPAID